MSDEFQTATGTAPTDPPTSTTPEDSGTPLLPDSPRTNDRSEQPPFTHTRASGYWAAVVVGLLVLLVLIIFILENGQRASVSFFGVHGHLPEGVALLLAAVIGGLFVVLSGAARILQLRSRARGQQPKGPRGKRSQWRRPA
jgi:uncharacterized integral membrane protein